MSADIGNVCGDYQKSAISIFIEPTQILSLVEVSPFQTLQRAGTYLTHLPIEIILA